MLNGTYISRAHEDSKNSHEDFQFSDIIQSTLKATFPLMMIRSLKVHLHSREFPSWPSFLKFQFQFQFYHKLHQQGESGESTNHFILTEYSQLTSPNNQNKTCFVTLASLITPGCSLNDEGYLVRKPLKIFKQT